jgi:hypothetical protein
MKMEDNPKALFDKLVTVQYKYSGHQQATISKDDLLAQAIQAIGYNLTMAGLIKAEQCTV